jgi:CRP/FNR family cyclic AMP-dependent transcriptional regulator
MAQLGPFFCARLFIPLLRLSAGALTAQIAQCIAMNRSEVYETFSDAEISSKGFRRASLSRHRGLARKIAVFQRKQAIFTQGDPAKNVLYVQQGGVKLCVVNESGKEAVVAILGPGDFFGEGCLGEEPKRINSAIAIMSTTVLVIGKSEMKRVLHAEHSFSDCFITYMLSRNIRVQEDLIDLLFNSTEKRLARTLLLLARYGQQGHPQRVIPKVSQEVLAEMVGTSRSRVNLFMNKFKRLGFIDTNGGLQIHGSLLSVVLRS